MLELKLSFKTHCWKETNRDYTMKLLAFFLSPETRWQGLFCQKENSRIPHVFGPVQWKNISYSIQVSSFCWQKNYNEATCSFKRLYKFKSMYVWGGPRFFQSLHCKLQDLLSLTQLHNDNLNPKFRSVYTVKCDASVYESLIVRNRRYTFLQNVWDLI
jgi:hypothetical protein